MQISKMTPYFKFLVNKKCDQKQDLGKLANSKAKSPSFREMKVGEILQLGRRSQIAFPRPHHFWEIGSLDFGGVTVVAGSSYPSKRKQSNTFLKPNKFAPEK